jgi:hypothetical protein
VMRTTSLARRAAIPPVSRARARTTGSEEARVRVCGARRTVFTGATARVCSRHHQVARHARAR